MSISKRSKTSASRHKTSSSNRDEAAVLLADLSSLRILRDQFVFDDRTGTFHRATESAAYILSELKRRTPISLISAQYAERYQVGQAIADRDVELFLNDLSIVGLQAGDATMAR